ncbi:D-alanyl-D-alanine carboxypeptidase [Alteromonas sp. MB-3u-76]|uniref:M15 family metallopeptidase n=1 Tax=Alteromonas sp. MB-3u-76 TaxID=2058133 RepID=UPI000C30D17F|nr:M15 family metallopeptidase [Alteromonas sp. MB-3u-76]AUC88891.1 D-alanyl-D-alanine carboxypeptidase [Alteromonas sp. MB-3u-76]
MPSSILKQQWLGQQNDYLVDAGHGHFLHPDVNDAVKAMQQKAHCDGIDLQIVSSYRSFDRQLAIFNRKWQGDAVLRDAQGNELVFSELSDSQKLQAILTWSALPGGSRHHWGTDLDVYDRTSVHQWSGSFELVEQEYLSEGPCYALACWLEDNMNEFGFYRPFEKNVGGVAREPWHISYKSVASNFELARSENALADALTQSEILGKDIILGQLPSLYQQYVLNKGES